MAMTRTWGRSPSPVVCRILITSSGLPRIKGPPNSARLEEVNEVSEISASHFYTLPAIWQKINVTKIKIYMYLIDVTLYCISPYEMAYSDEKYYYYLYYYYYYYPFALSKVWWPASYLCFVGSIMIIQRLCHNSDCSEWLDSAHIHLD